MRTANNGKKLIFLTLFLLLISLEGLAQNPIIYNDSILTGCQQTHLYKSILENKTVGVVSNLTAKIGSTHLVDTLLAMGIKVKKIFAPEHGFRGGGDAGEHVNNSVDERSGLPIISLYGDHKKPDTKDLEGIQIMVFDIQDVGVRFYTYISTLHYIMEACAENNIELLVLDRPNPNGFYVDGPVLKPKFTSFVGMHPVPIVYGLTIGEYAGMINGEGWLKNHVQCNLKVIPLSHYNHKDLYRLPENPSPNLRTMEAIFLYPSLCLFEGTVVSVGRGTEKPFERIGYPNSRCGDYVFTPKSSFGAKHPPFENQTCQGYNLENRCSQVLEEKRLILGWLMDFYQNADNKGTFFNSFFEKLAGTDVLKEQIIRGLKEKEIRQSWQEELNAYKLIRKKYLLYSDF